MCFAKITLILYKYPLWIYSPQLSMQALSIFFFFFSPLKHNESGQDLVLDPQHTQPSELVDAS